MPEYRADIDGLRAIAILPVVFFHAGFGFAQGGFVGVDVFFVISGYLITSLIHREMIAGEFSLVRFYERRVRGLFSASVSCTPGRWPSRSSSTCCFRFSCCSRCATCREGSSQ